jgi:hypothetical protein
MMRLALTMPFFALTLAPPCLAQSDDFNPYQAVLDGMPLAEAEPLIVAAYGDISDRSKGIPGKEDDAVLVLFAGTDEQKPMFVFCNDRLAAASATVTTEVAAAVLGPLSLPTSPPVEVYAHRDGVALTLQDRQLYVSYDGVGTEQSGITLNYPMQVFLNLDLSGLCAQVTD